MGVRELLFFAGSLALAGCGGPVRSQPPPQKWTNGFWFWHGSSTVASAVGVTVDDFYVRTGTINDPAVPYGSASWSVYAELPGELPPASEYWMVFRFELQSVPDLRAAPNLAREVSRLRVAANRRHLKVVGAQLDIDSPTSKLAEYASFLREVRKGLPSDMRISITALLDWFRDGTAVADVIREVDKFVPQFYDVAGSEKDSGRDTIAAKVDAAQWAPKLNRFRKRFRIGISTFGRARVIPNEAPKRPRGFGIFWYRDLTPLDIAVNAAFDLQTARNNASELVLSYRANRATRVGYGQFERGDTVQFILSTPETVRAAVEHARRMGGYCAGIIFFRWPLSGEALVMQPGEVLIAAGVAANVATPPAAIQVIDGGCAAVHCVDVYLVDANPIVPQGSRYKILSSNELEYFLPEEGMPVRMSGPRELEFILPPYCGRGRMYLGRAVTVERAEFTVSATAVKDAR